jgi:hypothetical protein
MPDTKEVGWSFFHKDDLKRALENGSLGCGFVYTRNHTSIPYQSDNIKNKRAGIVQNVDVETIIVLTGVKKDVSPLFLKRKSKDSSEGVAIASVEPCPKRCVPPMATQTPTECFELIYKPLFNTTTNSYPTDLGFELDETLFWDCQSKYNRERDENYQKFDSAYFSKDAIQQFVDDTDCIGIRCGVMLYYNTFRCMFVVGVKNEADRPWQYDKAILCSDLELDLSKPTVAATSTIMSKSLPQTKKTRKKP